MAKITVDEKYCKGCGLCTTACPRGIVQLDTTKITAKGYHPAYASDPERCTGCSLCAQICPDCCITVER